MIASVRVKNTVSELGLVCLFVLGVFGGYFSQMAMTQTDFDLYMYVQVHRGAPHFLCQTPGLSSLLNFEQIFALWSWHTIQMCRLPSFFDAITGVQQQPHVDGSG